MSAPPRQRLFEQLLWSLGATLVLSFGLVVVTTLTVGTRSLRASAQSELESAAHAAHVSVESFIEARSSDLHLAAQAETMDDVLTGDRDFRIQNALMELARAAPGTYEELFVADAQGTIVADTRPGRIGEPMPLSIPAQGETADEIRIAPGPAFVPGVGVRVLSMARPLHSRLAAKRSGWLVALVRWPALEALIARVPIAGRPQREQAFAVLYAGQVAIAGRVEWLPRALHDHGVTHIDHVMREQHDQRERRATALGPAGDWHVQVFHDSGEAFAVVRLFAWSCAVAGLLGLLAAAMMAYRIARGFSQRIAGLTRGTQQLAAGDYAHRVADPHDDELAQLADAFNTMAAALCSARDRIEKTHSELEDSNRRLREASRLKDEFLANTSHELRTPLNGILGFLGLVQDGLCDDVEEERQSVRQALSCAQSLRTLIEDILDVSRIEAGRLTLSSAPVPVARAFERIATEMSARAQAQGLSLRIEPLEDEALAVRADEQRLHQVLRHLVDNAIKFTARGSVTLACRAPEAMGHACFEVRDTGAGMSPERQAVAFERFVQGDGSATRQFGGTGLGLSLVRDLVEMMGGVVHIESAGEGQGTTIRFTLPLGWAATESRAPGDPPAVKQDRILGPAAGPLVLLVEDDPALTTWLRAILHADGFRTALSDSAEHGWLLVRQLRPVLVIMDHALPASANARIRTGAELARHMAANRPTAELPVIILSGHDPVRLQGEGALPRAAVALRKPVRREDLLLHVWRMVAEHRPNDTLASDGPATAA